MVRFRFYLQISLDKNNLENMLKSWFRLLESASAPVSLFTSTIRKKTKFNQFDFLAAAQALESLHRSLHGGVKLDEHGYQKCIDEMLKNIPPDTQEEIKLELERMLTSGNEWSLRKRLKFYFNKFKSIGERLVPDNKKFIQKTIEARNYYTHYDSKGKENVIEGVELFYISEKLKILILAEVLSQIGLDKVLVETQLAGHCRWGFMMNKELLKDK